jgi:hypothetical protein
MVPGSVEGRVSFSEDVPAASRPETIALVPRLLHVSRLYPSPEAPLASDGTFHLTGALGEYGISLPCLPSGFRVSLAGLPLRENRIGVGAGEAVTGLTVTVSK